MLAVNLTVIEPSSFVVITGAPCLIAKLSAVISHAVCVELTAKAFIHISPVIFSIFIAPVSAL